MPLSFIVAFSFSFILLGIDLGFAIYLLWTIIFTKVPFIPVPDEILPDIIKTLNLTENSKLYDLGCGNGRLLIECYKNQPKATYIGIEKDFIPFLLAKINLRKIDEPNNISIIRGNFLNQNISNATHIFVYLSPKMMDDILLKLKKELKPGTILISCDYIFNKKNPVKIISLNRSPKSRGKQLVRYEF